MTEAPVETVLIYDSWHRQEADRLADVVAGLTNEHAELKQLLDELRLRVERVLVVCDRPYADMAARHVVAEIEGILVDGLGADPVPEEFVWPYLRPYMQAGGEGGNVAS